MPDIAEEPDFIWYGPHGPEGDVATVVESWLPSDFAKVYEYQDVTGLIDDYDRDYPILKRGVTVSVEEAAQAYKDEQYEGVRISLDTIVKELAHDPLLFARWAAAVGVDKMAHWGAHSEEFVERIP